ncbi:hypothetical protein [Pseudoxanthomonas dokdonensis]|uniref:F5/8 type C domain-containing protein n=1 Tax=Pseudoxanthomonas dokdonensis TaxID=344882 RepID=A0A0R0CHS7_9GAMM|nr:hypothetical protein [Pseudoxanthomonas dokdonensis]KRG69125.1 hypothetical protein ABB29_11975 [Pseudoxanthomonas dokdonensis]
MSDRKVQISYSDDGGRNWSNWRERSLGELGEYGKRVRFWRLGRFRNRIYRIRVSSPIKRDLLGGVVNIQVTPG